MTKTLRLTLLGGLRIAYGEAELKGFVSRKAQALLVYLAVTGRAHFRDALAGLLWGESPEERAAGNLRVVLSNLRRLVPDHVIITRRTVEFNRKSACWIDVVELEGKMQEVRGRERADTSCVLQLATCLRLYRGDFLDGFYVRAAPAFDEWLLVERERLLQTVLQSLHCLVQHHVARGEYVAGIECVTRLLALDPWREEAHRELMRLLALSGQRSAALAQYEKCRRLLDVELGLEPLEETTALYQWLAAGETGRLAAWETGKLVDRAIRLPFKGRGDEHAQLVAWWEAALRRGEGRLALVEGEAGVGKTRLVEEATRYAESQGAVVLRGRCYEFGGSVPYQPIAEALRTQITNNELRIANLGDVWLAELARLAPEVRELRSDLPAPMRGSGEAARQRLFEAMFRFLKQVLSGASCILFLDDLHWADQSTLDLLHYLVRRLSGAPVWIVGTYRPEEATLSHPLTRLRQGLSRDHLVHRLILETLSSEAVEEIACSLVGEEEGMAFGALLYQESEGNSLILVETVNDLQEQGVLQEGEGERWHWSGPPAAKVLPVSVRDVVLQRVGRLSEPAQRLLTLAAVIGRQFDGPLLQAAAGWDVDAVDESLDEWLTRRLVLQHPTASSQHDFSHDKIRAVVYHAAGGMRRRMLHRRVGDALERLYAEQPEMVYEQLAYHYEQAGVTERALVYLPLAATRAAAVYANQEALDYYDRALALLDEEDARRWEILLQQGMLLRFLSRYDEAIAACREVVAAGQEASGDRLLAARAANELSAICRARRDYEEARAWVERAHRLAGAVEREAETEYLREQARAKQALGEIEREQGNLERAQGLFEETLALYRVLEDRRGVAECLNGLGRAFSLWGRYDAARQRLEESLAAFRDLGDRQREAACLREIGLTYWRQGANDAAHQAFTKSLEICQTIGDRLGEARCLKDLGLAYIAQGDHDETRHCLEESVALYRVLGLEKRVALCLHNLGILHIDQGDYTAAQQCLEESLAVSRTTGAKSNEVLNLGWLGKLHLLRGQYDDARRCLEAALTLDREVGGGTEEHWHLVWRGAVAYEMDDLSRANDYLQEAVRLAGKRGVNLGMYEVYWLVAVHLAQADGEAALDAARQALSAAEAQGKLSEIGLCCTTLGAVYGSGLLAAAKDPLPYFERALTLLGDEDQFERGMALRCYGAYLMHSSDPSMALRRESGQSSRHHREQGQAHLREAQHIFERLGAQGELEKATRLLAGDAAPRLRW